MGTKGNENKEDEECRVLIMAEPWVVLSEDDYPCPVIPPARAAGSVLNSYFTQELHAANDADLPCSAGQAESARVSDLPPPPAPVTLSVLALLTLPVALPLIVYMGVNNPFSSGQSGLLAEGLLDLDDDVGSAVNSAHKGRYLRTVDGAFEEELSRMAATSPPLVPVWAQPRRDSQPPSLRKVSHRSPEVAWPVARKGLVGFSNVTVGPPPTEEEDAALKRMLPFKKMLPFNDLPELLEFTRMAKGKRRGSKSSRIPVVKKP